MDVTSNRELPRGARIDGNGIIWIPRPNKQLEAVLDSAFKRIGNLRWVKDASVTSSDKSQMLLNNLVENHEHDHERPPTDLPSKKAST